MASLKSVKVFGQAFFKRLAVSKDRVFGRAPQSAKSLFRRALRKGLNLRNDPADRFAKRGNPAREGSPLLANFTNYPFTEQVKTANLDLVSSRLSASLSFLGGLVCTPIRRGGTFAPPKVPKSGLGLRPKDLRTGTPARNGYAVPKRRLNGAYRVSATHFYRLPRWSAEWRTTTPLPSSKEGNYEGSE